MALAELFDRVPALGRLEELSRAFARRQLVAVAVQDETLTLSWLQNGERHWHGADLPADLCRDGLPMQRQALGELCADLLLDCGLISALPRWISSCCCPSRHVSGDCWRAAMAALICGAWMQRRCGGSPLHWTGLCSSMTPTWP